MLTFRRKKGKKLEDWQVVLYASFVAQILSIMGFSASIPFIGAFYHGWSGVYMNTLHRVFNAFAHGAA